MKKIGIVGLALCSLLVAAIAVADFTTGYGKSVSVSATATNVTGFTVSSLSVFNQGPSLVYVLVNCDTNTFNARLTEGSAVAVPSGSVYTFNTQTKTSISQVNLATPADGSATALIAGF